LRLGLKSQHINELQLPHQHTIAEAPSDRLNGFLENCPAPQMPAEKQPLPCLSPKVQRPGIRGQGIGKLQGS
jgi:hypothetical protein